MRAQRDARITCARLLETKQQREKSALDGRRPGRFIFFNELDAVRHIKNRPCSLSTLVPTVGAEPTAARPASPSAPWWPAAASFYLDENPSKFSTGTLIETQPRSNQLLQHNILNYPAHFIQLKEQRVGAPSGSRMKMDTKKHSDSRI